MENKNNLTWADLFFKQHENTLPKKHNRVVITDGTTIYENDGLKYCVVCDKPLQLLQEHHSRFYKLPIPCDCIKKQEENKAKQLDFQKHLQRIPIEFRGVFLKDLTVPVNFVKPFIDNFATEFKPNAKGLHIYGNKGSGKTFACKCIINELCNQNVRVFAIRFTKLLDIYSNFNDKQVIKDVENKIKHSHLIYLDDVGATRETDFAVEKINDIINFIYELKIPIIITSNVSRNELYKELNTNIGRAYDRLFERCHPIKLENESFRLVKAKEDKAKFDSILGLN